MQLPVLRSQVWATTPARSYALVQDSMSTAGYVQKHGDSSAAPLPARRNLSRVASHQSHTTEESPPPESTLHFFVL